MFYCNVSFCNYALYYNYVLYFVTVKRKIFKCETTKGLLRNYNIVKKNLLSRFFQNFLLRKLVVVVVVVLVQNKKA